MGMKAALMAWRCGQAERRFWRGPQVGVDLQLVAEPIEQGEDLGGRQSPERVPIGMTSGSTMMSCGFDAVIHGAFDDLLWRRRSRTSGSMEMPVSSLEMATTGTSYFLISGRMASSFSSSPGDRIDQGAAARDLEHCLDGGGDGGVDRQRHVGPGSGRSPASARGGGGGGGVQRRFGGVRIDGGDACIDVEDVGAGGDLLQRILAHRVQNYLRTSRRRAFLRPVGLMRSPMTRKGWSKPMTTSFRAEATMVRVIQVCSRQLSDCAIRGFCQSGLVKQAGRRRSATSTSVGSGLAFPGLAALENAGFSDDLGHEFFLAVGHDVNAADALDFLDLVG